MIRTAEQEAEYQSLEEKARKMYDFNSDQNPDLSHAKVMLSVGIHDNVIKHVKDGGRNIDPTSPETAKTILIKTGEWLQTFEEIWDEVCDAFEAALDFLCDIIDGVISFVGNVWDKIKWIFS